MSEATSRALEERLAAQGAALAAQAAELASLRADQAALRARLATAPRRQQARRRGRVLPALALALFVALVPPSVLAVNPFTDLTGGVHDANIDAIYNAGVTTGCVPNLEYCPTANVTREEMASFLARLGGLGTNPPVANALTAQTATNAGHATTAGSATSATTATNAAQLGGLPAGAYLQSGGDLLFTFSSLNFRTDDSAVEFSFTSNGILNVGTANAPADRDIFLALDVPIALFGVPLSVASVDICSFTSGGGAQPFVTLTTLYDVVESGVSQIATSGTDQPEGTCYTIAPPTPTALQGALTLRLRLTFANTTATFTIMRVMATLTP